MERYSRQILYKNIGEVGQERLLQKTVTIVGMGALGSLSSEMLARLGIGKLILIDRDYVELSNLQRQTLYTEEDVEKQKPKAIASYEHLKEIRSDLNVEVHVNHCDALFLESVIHDTDLILDGTDNFETRLMINDVAYKHNIPWVHAAVLEASYVSAPFIPLKSPCYRCIMPVLPSHTLTCDTAGIISPAVHTAVSIQVTTAIKILTDQLEDKHYMTFGDLWSGEHNRIAFDNIHNRECKTCVTKEYPSFYNTNTATSLCGRNTVQIYDENISYDKALFAVKNMQTEFKETPYFLEFNYDDYRIVVFKNGRMLLHGTHTVKKANTVIAQLFG